MTIEQKEQFVIGYLKLLKNIENDIKNNYRYPDGFFSKHEQKKARQRLWKLILNEVEK